MPFEENQFFMNQFVGEQTFPGTAQQFEQGQVNNFVNHTTRMGNRQAVENVNYYDTYHHRINNYHTMNTNRYRDHYVDHNVYYNHTRNIYDGADYYTVYGNVVDRGRTGSNEGYSTTSNGGYSIGSNEGYSTIQGQGNCRRYPGCGCRYRRDEDDRRYYDDRGRSDRDRREQDNDRGRFDRDRREQDNDRRRSDRDRREQDNDRRRCDRDRRSYQNYID
ncbi:hypothetical protein [Intestinibacter sp.]